MSNIITSAKEYGYKPYSGGAVGPEEQIHKNNLALQSLLKDYGIQSNIIKDSSPEWDGEIESVVVGSVSVGYDRWGFCSDIDLVLDQADLIQTLAYILERRGEENED